MYRTIEYLKSDMLFQENLRKKYELIVQDLPKGGLSSSIKNGKIYYSTYEMYEGKAVRKYLGDQENNTVLKLQERKLLEETIKRTKINKKAIKDFLRCYKSINPNDIFGDLPRAYNTLPNYCFSSAGVIDPKKWGKRIFNENQKYAEHLRHITSKGEKVRSKSEVIIANALFAKGYQYKYEDEVVIGGVVISPDFKILLPRDHREKLWEHFGMTSDNRYLDNCLWKIKLYINNGYMPWRDIIFTFDDENGNLNALEINRIIECML